MIDRDQVRLVLDAFETGGDVGNLDGVARTRELIARKQNPFDRADFDPGHITASAVVLSPDLTAVILVKHDRVGRWIQPGGHVEPSDLSLERAAGREVIEETGVSVTPNEWTRLVRVDVHEIPPFRNEPSHVHHDLTFGFRAMQRDALGTGDSTWMWCPIDELAAHGVEPRLSAAVHQVAAAYHR